MMPLAGFYANPTERQQILLRFAKKTLLVFCPIYMYVAPPLLSCAKSQLANGWHVLEVSDPLFGRAV